MNKKKMEEEENHDHPFFPGKRVFESMAGTHGGFGMSDNAFTPMDQWNPMVGFRGGSVRFWNFSSATRRLKKHRRSSPSEDATGGDTTGGGEDTQFRTTCDCEENTGINRSDENIGTYTRSDENIFEEEIEEILYAVPEDFNFGEDDFNFSSRRVPSSDKSSEKVETHRDSRDSGSLEETVDILKQLFEVEKIKQFFILYEKSQYATSQYTTIQLTQHFNRLYMRKLSDREKQFLTNEFGYDFL